MKELTVGQKLAAARHSPQTYARSIVRNWPTLSSEVRAEIRALLSPVITKAGE